MSYGDPNIPGDAAMSDDIFDELVRVLAFSAESAAVIGGVGMTPELHGYLDDMAQARGFDTWREAADDSERVL